MYKSVACDKRPTIQMPKVQLDQMINDCRDEVVLLTEADMVYGEIDIFLDDAWE